MKDKVTKKKAKSAKPKKNVKKAKKIKSTDLKKIVGGKRASPIWLD